jgi:3-hydroxyisobutyrate dehydrogenase
MTARMPNTKDRVGWIGTGRMGYAMVERLLAAKVPVSVWNRTRSKAEPLQASGAVIVDQVVELAGLDIVFVIVAKAADLEAVCFGEAGLLSGKSHPSIIVDCSTIGLDDSAAIRERLAAKGIAFIASPVSGNGKVVAAGLLSAILSGPDAACQRVKPYMQQIAARGVSYAGEGDLARVCKIAHNVMLGVVTQALCETTLLAQKAGVPRHAFLDFLNNSVMGSMFTRYKSSALVNLDWTPTFTAALLRKDLDLGLGMAREMELPMPVTALTRELVQAHLGTDKAELDFAALLETLAGLSGVKLVSENKVVPTGLEVPVAPAAKH